MVYRLAFFTRWSMGIAFALALTSACARALSPAEQWVEDIDALHRELERRHIDLYHNIRRAELVEQLNELKLRVPKLTQPQIMVALMGIIKQVGDGHTQFNYWGAPHHRYPLQFRLFGDEVRVVGADQNNRDLLGMRLYAIDKVNVEALIERFTPILQGVENAYSERNRLASALTVAEVLQGLGITRHLEKAEFVFTGPQGRQHSRSIRSLPSLKTDQAITARLEPQLPASFTVSSRSLEEVALHLDKELSTAYIRFDRYPTQSQMQRFALSLREEFHEQGIRRVVIDLRNNGGGDFFVGLTLAWGLILIDQLEWENGMYVLTGPQTFSAAMSNSVQYRQILNARLVGEPTGANPVGYQDAGTFQLPHSRWTVMYSKRLYRFQKEDSEGVQPDVFITPDWEQYRQGKDNQLQWVLSTIKNGGRP